MSDIILESEKVVTSKQDIPIVQPLAAGLSHSCISNPQVIERVGVATVKMIGKKFLADPALSVLNKIAEDDVDGCRDFILGPHCEGKSFFLNAIDHISLLATHEHAMKLVEAGASLKEKDASVISYNAFFNHQNIFQNVLLKVEQTQDAPDRAYDIFQVLPGKRIKREISAADIENFRLIMKGIYERKDLGQLCRIFPIRQGTHVGFAIEHGTPKAGLQTVQNETEPDNLSCRLRKCDFVFADRNFPFIMVNSKVGLAKSSKDIFLKALGDLFYGDENACRIPGKIDISKFNSRAFVPLLVNHRMVAVTAIKIKKLWWQEECLSDEVRCKKASGKNSCITDNENWASNMPQSWVAVRVLVHIHTVNGTEKLNLNLGSIGLGCNENLPLVIATLNQLKVIPNVNN